MPNSTLTLFKASAGSGKTFTLAVRYIAMLVRNQGDYAHTLAVTFTNKATAEMKQRILSQLYGISRCLPSSEACFAAVREQISPNTTDDEIRSRCAHALDLILQDYGHFRIETIDGFFQSILRGLARELQLGGNLAIELDTDQVISDATDAFLAGLRPGSAESTRVIRFIEENISGDANWSVDKKLKLFAKQLFHEVFMENSDRFKDVIEHPEKIEEFRQMLLKRQKADIDAIRKECGDTGAKLQQLAAGLPGPLTANSTKLIESIADGSYLDKNNPGTTITGCIENPEKYFVKATLKSYPDIANAASTQLTPLLELILQIRESYISIVNSYALALKYLHEMGLLVDIRREINRQNEENGRFVLPDTAHLLGQLKDGDSSFVFEKTGSFTSHLMIDEFQDTSHLQWNNLSILLRECLSRNNSCLVVGDVKQSIYRWRNGDWNILNTGIEREFSTFHPDTVSLGTNRRSLPEIIRFNNSLFPKATEMLCGRYRQEFNTEHPALAKAYAEVHQEIARQDPEGWVHVGFADENQEMEQMVEAELDRLTAAGVKQSDITVLCRNGKEIERLAEYFSTQCNKYKMVSAEAFKLGASVSVRICTGIMRWLENSVDTVSLAQAVWEWRHFVCKDAASMQEVMQGNLLSQLPESVSQHADRLKGLPLYELAAELYRLLDLGRADGQDAYMLSFLDVLRQFSANGPADLAAFNEAWDAKLHDKAVPPARIDGVQLMTVHKSKGLQFHTVIVPYCSWNMVNIGSHAKSEQLWIQPDVEPFSQLSLLPVEFNSKLGKSVFSRFYQEEAGLQIVDNLNILYVALTRPECNLSILCDFRKEGDDNLNFGANTVMEEAMTAAGLLSQGQADYETGSIVASVSRQLEDKSDSANPFEINGQPMGVSLCSYELSAEFRQSGQSDRFVHDAESEEGVSSETWIEKGKLIHALFSAIETDADVDREALRMLQDGLLRDAAEASALAGLVRECLQDPQAKDWFSGRYRLYNETPVIFRRNGVLQNRRPDRVMTDGRSAIVVDFKTGIEKEEHFHQVQEYMELLSQMGYSPVKGYIWYVLGHKITEC